MGLRPSVKNDDNNNGGSAYKSHNNDNNNESSSHKASPPASSSSMSSPSTTTAPQREAWTARGQLLLNFHHAISKAINSPEMMRKCNEIARDMEGGGDGGIMTPQSLPSSATAASAQLLKSPSSSHNNNSSSIADEYSAEAALIVENKSKRDALVRNKSLALGLLSFVTLRSGRGLSAWVRKSIAARAASRSSSYQFDKPAHLIKNSNLNIKHHANNTTMVGESSPTVQQLAKEPSKLRKFLRLSIDMTISTSITFLSGTFLFMPRPSAYIEDMSQLPLVEGKSVYAEMVCPPLLKEYRRVLEQYGGRWPVSRGGTGTTTADSMARQQQQGGGGGGGGGAPQLTQEDVSLNVIRTFVENCSKRSKYERALLEERNDLNLHNNSSTTTSSTVSRLMRRMTSRSDTTTNSNSSKDDTLSEGGANSKKKNKLGTVPIPSPGVPKHVSVNLDQDVFLLDSDDDDDDDGDYGKKEKEGGRI
ncbi:hypothetical protein ACHAXR_008877 [Thalassiosira sp. AJA248-18]